MGYYVKQLKSPYDYKRLVDVYIYTKRTDFVHEDFNRYYQGLLHSLEQLFKIGNFEQSMKERDIALGMLFDATLGSLRTISTPWSRFLEATLIISRLKDRGDLGAKILKRSDEISEAAKRMADDHQEILYDLFVAIFGEHPQQFTSQDLLAIGFDDTKEPNIIDYYDYF